MRFLIQDYSVNLIEGLEDKDNKLLGSCEITFVTDKLLTVHILNSHSLIKQKLTDIPFDKEKNVYSGKGLYSLDTLCKRSKYEYTPYEDMGWIEYTKAYLKKKTDNGSTILREALSSILVGSYKNFTLTESKVDVKIPSITIGNEYNIVYENSKITNPISMLFGMPPKSQDDIHNIIYVPKINEYLYLVNGDTNIKVIDEVSDVDTLYYVYNWLFTNEILGIELESNLEDEGKVLIPKIIGDIEVSHVRYELKS